MAAAGVLRLALLNARARTSHDQFCAHVLGRRGIGPRLRCEHTTLASARNLCASRCVDGATEMPRELQIVPVR